MEGVGNWTFFFVIREEVFRNGMRNKCRVSWVQRLARAIFDMLIAMSTFATQT